jgi:hypothetical protein
MVDRLRTAPPPGRMVPAAAALGASWGLSLLVIPKLLLRLSGALGGSGVALAAARLLGARHVAEAVGLTAAGPRARRPIVLVESLHALTMGALAIGSHRYRRAAMLSGSVAVVLALLTRAEARPERMTG